MEYISRETAVEKITTLCELREIVCNPDDEFLRGLKNALNAIKSNEIIPSADAQPVKHGRWIPKAGEFWWLCSNCKNNIIYSTSDRDRTEKQRYCSKCGARMDGDPNG